MSEREMEDTPSLQVLITQIRALLEPFSSSLLSLHDSSNPSNQPLSSSSSSNEIPTGRGLSHLPASLPHQLQHVMRRYTSKEDDFLPYAYFPSPEINTSSLPPHSEDEEDASSTDTASSSSSPRLPQPSQDRLAQPDLDRRLFPSAACSPIRDPSSPQKTGSYSSSQRTGSYSRNLVDKGNGEYNLLVLCWPPGSKSQIHDHPGSHCIVKMLKGKLREVRYRLPEQGKEGELVKTSERVLERDGVTYMHDKFGLHSMHNDSSTSSAEEDSSAISLHLYSPPIPLCRVFDPRDDGTHAKVVDCRRVESVGGVRA